MHMFKFLSRRCRKRHAGAFSLLELLLVVAIIGLLIAVMMPPIAKADQQGYPTTYVAPTNMPATVATATLTGSLNSFVPIKQGRGASLQVQFNVSSGTSNVVYQIAPSTDGTNIDSVVWPWTVVASGTTTVTRTTNWSRGSLDGYAALVIVAITNQNAGTFTNKSMLFNIPNY